MNDQFPNGRLPQDGLSLEDYSQKIIVDVANNICLKAATMESIPFIIRLMETIMRSFTDKESKEITLSLHRIEFGSWKTVLQDP